MKYIVCEDERYPTLYVDTYSWAEPETREYLKDQFVEIPENLVVTWQIAEDNLKEAEDAIKKYLGWK